MHNNVDSSVGYNSKNMANKISENFEEYFMHENMFMI